MGEFNLGLFARKDFSILIFIFGFTFSASLFAQETSVLIANKQSKSPIGYAQIFIDNKIIAFSNSTGVLSLDFSRLKNNDSIKLTAIGYKTFYSTLKNIKIKDSILMNEEIQTLESVFIANRKLTAREIIEKAKQNVLENYKLDSLNFKINKTETTSYEFKNFDIKAKKLTLVIDKSKRQDFKNNLEMYIDSMNNTTHLSRKSYSFKFRQLPFKKPSTKQIGETDSFVTPHHPHDVANWNYILEKAIFPFINTELEFKIKSGIVPFDDSYKIRSPHKNKKYKEKINKDWHQKNILNPMEYDFLKNSDDYSFSLQKTVSINEKIFYHLTFFPKRNNKKMEGQVYISATDFGILKGDFHLVEGKNLQNVNLKIPLGAAYKENIHTVTFGYINRTGKYIPKYFSIKNGEYNYLNRDYRMKFKNKNWLKSNDKITSKISIEGQGFNLTEITFEEN